MGNWLEKTCENIKMLPDYKTNFTKNSIEIINYNAELHDIPAIWSRTKGEGIKIGLLDTGLPDHNDVKDKIKDYANFTSDSSVRDIDGHATWVSGKMVGESKNPKVGIIGVAPKADLYVAKVMNDQGMGNDEWLAKGIKWCVDNGCQVINMSLGAPAKFESQFVLTRKEVLKASSKNVFMFAAAGNDGVKSISVPARWNEVFCIVSIDRDQKHSKFSNCGAEADFSGLGENIISTWLNNTYSALSGTSMASPDVAAIAALILSDHLYSDKSHDTPIINFMDMREHLIKLCTDFGAIGYDEVYGWGNPVFSKPDQTYDPKNMGGIVIKVAVKKPWWKFWA
jgi:subtilisin family serine protease